MYKIIIIAVVVLAVVYGMIASSLTKAGKGIISERNAHLEQLLNNK